jgi:hypothetical protein
LLSAVRLKSFDASLGGLIREAADARRPRTVRVSREELPREPSRTIAIAFREREIDRENRRFVAESSMREARAVVCEARACAREIARRETSACRLEQTRFCRERIRSRHGRRVRSSGRRVRSHGRGR